MNLQRVHIIGGPGCGKSTLAHALASTLNLPVFELDHVAFEGKDFVTRPLADRLTDIHTIASQSSWLTEGIFLDWVEELVQRADLILWLDHLTWQQATRRIVRRFTNHGWRNAKAQSGHRKFSRTRDYQRALAQLADVLVSSHAYYTRLDVSPARDIRYVTRAQTFLFLEPWILKVIHIQSEDTLKTFLSAVTSRSSESPRLNRTHGSENAIETVRTLA